MNISDKKNMRKIVKTMGYDTSEMTDSEVETAIRDKFLLFVDYDCEHQESIYLLPREHEYKITTLSNYEKYF